MGFNDYIDIKDYGVRREETKQNLKIEKSSRNPNWWPIEESATYSAAFSIAGFCKDALVQIIELGLLAYIAVKITKLLKRV